MKNEQKSQNEWPLENFSVNSDIRTQEVTPINYKYIQKPVDPEETLSDNSHYNNSSLQIDEFKYNKNIDFGFNFDMDDNYSNFGAENYSNNDFISSSENFDLKWFDVQCDSAK